LLLLLSKKGRLGGKKAWKRRCGAGGQGFLAAKLPGNFEILQNK
jgi:hypothetical protein